MCGLCISISSCPVSPLSDVLFRFEVGDFFPCRSDLPKPRYLRSVHLSQPFVGIPRIIISVLSESALNEFFESVKKERVVSYHSEDLVLFIHRLSHDWLFLHW